MAVLSEIDVMSSIHSTAPVTVAGPMTTPFIASQDCLEGLYLQSVLPYHGDDDDPDRAYFSTLTYFARQGADFMSTPGCLPDGYATAVAFTNPVMSPATACPERYAARCTMVGVSASVSFKPDVYIWQALEPSQVAVGCCPVGFDCVQSAPYECVSYPSVGEKVTLRSEDYAGFDGDASTMVLSGPGSRITATATATRLIYVQPKETQTDRESMPLSGYVRTDGLPPEYIAAIVVPIVFIVALTVGLSIWAFKRRHNNDNDNDKGYADDHVPEKGKQVVKTTVAAAATAPRSSKKKSKMRNASTQTGPHRPGSSHSAPERPGAMTKAAEEGLYIPRTKKSKGKQKATERGTTTCGEAGEASNAGKEGDADPTVMSGAV